MENYIYGLKNALTDEMKSNLEGEDIESIEKIIKDGLEWLENEDRSIDDYESKYNEFENISKPIFTKMYQSQQSEQPEQPEQSQNSQPEIDEVE